MYIAKETTYLVRIHVRSSTKLENFLRLNIGAGELARRWNQIYSSLLKTYEKLKKLGYIYQNGEIVFIEE